MTSSSNDVDFLTAIGIIPLSIAEYRSIDEVCVRTESKFRTSPLDTPDAPLDDVEYRRQLENRVNNLSSKSDRPSQTLATGPEEWRTWLKSKTQQDANLESQIKRLTIDESKVEELSPIVIESKIDDSISLATSFEDDVIRETDLMVPSRIVLSASLATFVKSCDQFDLFESTNHETKDATQDDIIAVAALFN